MSHSASMFDSPQAERSRLEPFLFGATLLAATLLYLVTEEPALAAILPCLHGGWNTFRTGIWLLRADPCRSRARTCFAFHLAAACWKAGAAALVTVGLFVVAARKFGFQPNMKEFAAMMLVVAAGAVLNTLLGVGAICAALACKIRVWVHPRLRAVTHGDLRQVAGLTPLQSGLNHAIFVVATALAFPALAAGTIALAVLTVGKNPNELETVSVIVLTCGAFFGPPLAMIPCYVWLSSRVIACSPHEGWPEMTHHHRPQEPRSTSTRQERMVMLCTFDQCSEVATFHLTYVESRRCCREEHLCEEHARTALTDYATLHARGRGRLGAPLDRRCFDIDLIVISEVNDQQVVYLREMEGDSRIPILIGIFEATSLDRKVREYPSPRPLTHDATAMIIRALGAEVADVVLDTVEQHAYHAKVHLRQGNAVRTVDIRPSDALALALAFDCPIFFADAVLDQLR